MTKNIDEKVVFAISPKGTGDGVPLLILGVPRDAFEYMRDGKTHDFDLTRVGIPLKLLLFGATDHADAMATIDKTMKAAGVPYLDRRRDDFSISQVPPPSE